MGFAVFPTPVWGHIPQGNMKRVNWVLSDDPLLCLQATLHRSSAKITSLDFSLISPVFKPSQYNEAIIATNLAFLFLKKIMHWHALLLALFF